MRSGYQHGVGGPCNGSGRRILTVSHVVGGAGSSPGISSMDTNYLHDGSTLTT